MSNSWEEVKRLAADFQRAQLSSSIQRLSDRNCIEIVKKLISLKLVDVVFTTSGREYITPQHLLKEIQDELIVAGGRIDLSTLASNLQVDVAHIESAVAELLKSEKNIELILDQLISDSYMDQLAEEINERLQQKGELSIADIIKAYDIPADFLRTNVLARMGKIIKGQTDDKEVLYTEAFVTMHRYRLRGALGAVTRPIQMSTLIKNFDLPHRIVLNIVDQLISQKKLRGSLSGHDERAFFTPEIYQRAQKDWVNNGFSQNGFLEYDALSRLGLGDPKSYAKSILKDKNVVFLSSAVVGEQLLNQIESSMEEAHLTGSWVDVATMLPSQLNPADVNQIISHVVQSNKDIRTSVHIIADTVIASSALIESCAKTFEPLMNAKADKDLQSGLGRALFDEKDHGLDDDRGKKKGGFDDDDDNERKEERRKKATGGKSGGGTQGRETKMKSTKKKYGKKKNQDSDSDVDDAPKSKKVTPKVVFMSIAEITKHLLALELLHDCPEELAQGIAELIERQLNLKYKEVVQRLYLSSVNSSAPDRRKTHADLQEKITSALGSINLYVAGLEVFDGDLQSQLTKHLLRSLCTDLVNSIVLYLAAENGIQTETEAINPDQRLKLINKFPSAQKEALAKVHQSLNSAKADEFVSNMNGVCGAGVLDMMIRNDRKRDRQTMTAHKMTLLDQLASADDPALALHIAVLVVVQMQVQKMVHFSGKFVPQMILFLKNKIAPEMSKHLSTAQELVMKNLATPEDDPDKKQVTEELRECVKTLKSSVVDFKRISESK